MSEFIDIRAERMPNFRKPTWWYTAGYGRLLGKCVGTTYDLLWMHADSHGENSRASATTIARLGGGHERTVRRDFELLERWGLTRLRRRPGRTAEHVLATTEPGTAGMVCALVVGLPLAFAPRASAPESATPGLTPGVTQNGDESPAECPEAPANPPQETADSAGAHPGCDARGSAALEPEPRAPRPDTPGLTPDERKPGRDSEKNPPYPPPAGGIGEADFPEPDPELDDPADPRAIPGDSKPEVGQGLTDAEIRRFELSRDERADLAKLLKFDPAWPEFGRVVERMLEHFKSLPVARYHARGGNTDVGESWKRYLAGKKRWEEIGKDELETIRTEALRKQRQFEQRERDRKKREAEQAEALSAPGAFGQVAAKDPERAAKYARLFGRPKKPRRDVFDLLALVALDPMDLASMAEMALEGEQEQPRAAGE